MPENEYPQFDTARYPATPTSATPTSATPGTDHCAACNQPVAGLYYRINGKTVCGSCTDRVRRQVPVDSHAGYIRGVLFGVGAAILGLILYAGFTIATGFYIGYVSLAVGWMVGKAIMMGSKGIGGRRYQIAALLLTYAAVSMAAIPIAIAYQMNHKSGNPSATAKNPQPSTATEPSAGGDQAAPSQEKPQAGVESEQKTGLAAGLVKLALLGLASPFLELEDPVHGVIGLIILFVGIRIAWKMTQQGTQRVDIHGPYGTTSAAPA